MSPALIAVLVELAGLLLTVAGLCWGVADLTGRPWVGLGVAGLTLLFAAWLISRPRPVKRGESDAAVRAPGT